MNRFKRETRRRGIKLECDYEWLPYNSIEAVQVDSTTAVITEYSNTMGPMKSVMLRTGDIIDPDASTVMRDFWDNKVVVNETIDGQAVVQCINDHTGDHIVRRFPDYDTAYNWAYDHGYRD